MLREVGRRSLAASRNDVALRAYRALLDVQPDDAEALKRAGQLMAWSNDGRGARAALERFNRVKVPDYEVHYLLGELYTAEHDEERARAQYERVRSACCRPGPADREPAPRSVLNRADGPAILAGWPGSARSASRPC